MFQPLHCSFPEITSDVWLQIVVRRTATVAANRARNGTRMVMRPTGTGRLSAR